MVDSALRASLRWHSELLRGVAAVQDALGLEGKASCLASHPYEGEFDRVVGNCLPRRLLLEVARRDTAALETLRRERAQISSSLSEADFQLASAYIVSRTSGASRASSSSSGTSGPEVPLELIRFDLLARLPSRSSLTTQIGALEKALEAEAERQTPLTAEERRVLAALASGQKMADVAEAESVSERTLYRRTGDICARLGTTSLREAISTAAESGWLVGQGRGRRGTPR